MMKKSSMHTAPNGRMPPVCENGKFPCVLKYYGMSCHRCEQKPLPTCVYRDQPRERDPVILQATRDKDPHYKDFDEASKNLGGNGGGQANMPPSRRTSPRAARALTQNASLEKKVEELTNTVAQLVNMKGDKVIRKVKRSQPRTQQSSSESEEESESEESSDDSVDPHKAQPLPPTSVAGSRRSTASKASSK